MLALIIFISACAVNPVTGRGELMFMTEQEELRLGQQVYPDALWGDLGGGGPYRDPELERYLNSVVMDLHGVSHRPELPLDFVIQNSSVPNAWAIPGHIAMTRGLLAAMENEAQFSFVMGHELGHVAARHTAKQYTRSVITGLAFGGGSLVLGETQGWLLQAAAIGSGLFLLKYSREQELEADRLGVLYMARAGYRPGEAAAAHRRLLAAVEDYSRRMGKGSPEESFLSGLLSTHPRAEVRLEEVGAEAEKVIPQALRGDGVNAGDFLSKTASLREIEKAYHHYDKALALYREKRFPGAEAELNSALEINEAQPPFHTLRGLLHLAQGRYADAEASLKRALEIDERYQPAWQGLGLHGYQRKDYRGALAPLKRSLEIYPGNPASHYLMGMSHFMLRGYREAIPHLEVFKEAAPRHEEIHGVLGISYEAGGKLSRAYSEYVLQVRIAPNTELGRHAARRAAALERMGTR